MSQEIFESIERALEILSWCQENADEKWMVDHLMAVRKDIDQALTLLKQQPPAGEFTKETRINFTTHFENPDWVIHKKLMEACDIIDRAEAENKELKEIILTAPGSDEDNFLSKHRIWWDLHYRELRSPDCNLPRPTFKQLKDRLDRAESLNVDLLAACKQAHKEGYESGYTDGVETDGCVESNIIDQNDYAKAWNISVAKVAIAKAKPVEVNLNSQ